MSKYTIADAKTIIPQDLTPNQIQGVEAYLNYGIIPPADPCGSCEPNFIRKLISTIQVAERNGLWPPARQEVQAKPSSRRKANTKEAEDTETPETQGTLIGGKDDPEVDFTEVFKDK